jgi:hypothetical protein
LNSRVISEYIIGKDLNSSSHDLISDLSWHLSGGNLKPQKV